MSDQAGSGVSNGFSEPRIGNETAVNGSVGQKVGNEKLMKSLDGLYDQESLDAGSFDQNALDAGALFVLESKGNWVHAGYHLTTSIVAPALLSLPFAIAGLGWAIGIAAIVVGAAVSFYSYNILAMVLESCANEGRRHLRFRDVAEDVMGRRFSIFLVIPIQFTVCFGAVVFCVLLGGESLKFIYKIYNADGDFELYKFIIIFGALFIVLSQLPSFHSLRYVNLVSLLMALGYSMCVVGGSIYAGKTKNAPPKDYSLLGSSTQKFFEAFNSLAIIATTYGNGIIPEIQATLAPPTTGKMFKGLLICYAVAITTFFTGSISGYWAFGNTASGNIFANFSGIVPNWLILLANIFVIIQLFAVGLVYAQPSFEVFEGKSANVKKGRFAARNVLPRFALRTIYCAAGTFVAAMFPFFGDLNAIIGAFCFTPLDFVFPMLFFIVMYKPSKRSYKFWVNAGIALVFSLIGVMGCISAVRQLALDANQYKLFANV